MLDRRAVKIAICATLFAAFLCSRLIQQLNYLPIHVCVPQEVAATQPVLTAVSSDGRRQQLTQRQENLTVFSMLDGTIPVQRIQVSLPEGTVLTADGVRIVLGSGWPPPVALLRNPALTVHENLNHSSAPQAAIQSETWLTAQPFAVSKLPGQPDAINWQGDLWLLLVPLLQSFVCLLLLKMSSTFVQSALAWLSRCNEYATDATCFQRARTWCSKLTTLALALLILCQIQFQVRSFLNVRDGLQFFIALCISAALLYSFKWWAAFLRRREQTSSRVLTTSLLIGTIFLAKLFWVTSVTTAQTDDYAKYFRYGGHMASGNWDDLAREQTPLLRLFVERAAVYTLPVASLFGQGMPPIEITNVILQSLTAAVTTLLIGRMFGNLTACLSAPLLLLYPSFWYSPTLATPQIPGFFWMSLVWLAFEQLRRLAVRTQRTPLTPFIAIQAAVLAAALTFCTIMLEIQKSLGLFAFLAAGAVITVGLCNLISRRHASLTRIAAVSLLSFGTLFISWQTTQLTCREVRKTIADRLPVSAKISLMGYFSSVDSTTDASSETVSNWRFSYLPAVPGNYQTQINLRKLLHEKIASFSHWIYSPLKKSITLGTVETEDYLIKTFGSLSDAHGLSRDYTRVPWLRTQKKISQAVYIALLFLTLLRLCNSRPSKIAPAELFPLAFVLLNLLVVLFFAESAPYYAQILAFPLVWSSALQLSNKPAVPTASAALPSLACGIARFLTPLAVILLICIAIGQAVDSSGWSFLKLSATAVTNHAQTQQVSFSRVHQSLQIPSIDNTLKAGTYETEISIINPWQHSDVLAFFVTGDTRSRNLYFPKSHWKSLPVAWSVTCQNKCVASGRLHQLQPPQFLQLSKADFPPESAANKTQLTLKLSITASQDLSLSKTGFAPAIAIEYPFNTVD